MNVNFWFCNDDFNKKTIGKNTWFCCCSRTSKTVIFIFVEIQTEIFCKHHGPLGDSWLPRCRELSSQCSQQKDEPMFAWLTELQFFKQVAFFSGAFGRRRSQRVNFPKKFSHCWWFWLIKYSDKKLLRPTTFFHHCIWKHGTASRPRGEGTSWWPLISLKVKVAPWPSWGGGNLQE